MKLPLSILSCVAVLSFPVMASAQSLTVRAEGGVAVPLTTPQSERFDVGGAGFLKPEIGIGSYFGIGPYVSYMVLPSNVPGIDAGTATALGGFVRLKRPHDEKNTSSGFEAVSPFVDANVGYVRTDALNRLSGGVAVGAHIPTSDSRQLWIGPFASYQLVNQEDGKPFTNTNSAKTAIFGLSFEFGAAQKEKQAVKEPEKQEKQPEPVVEKKKETPPEVKIVEPTIITFKPRIPFNWDSAELLPVANQALESVVKAMLADTTYNVKVEGHASSEGMVEYNNKLSLRRAQSVAEFLVAHGVDCKRLTVVGFGSKHPVADNKTEEGRVQNRRVEFDMTFTIVKKGDEK